MLEFESDEDYARDLELLFPDSPFILADHPLFAPVTILSSSRDGREKCDEKYAALVRLQDKEIFYKVEGGLMTLLKKCLERDSENNCTLLSGDIDHFQSTEEDSRWGCGWHNIQMLSSYLLMQRPELRDVLYGGSGFVPNIVSIQNWLELAWEKGFDTQGSVEFDNHISGQRKWIGTTECAALLRSFGIRAMLVDFSSKDTGKKVDKRKHLSLLSTKKKKGITKWVWDYFSDSSLNKSGNRVFVSLKSPLYFQHAGHSRTIVGIQSTQQRNMKQDYNLLIFDPGEKTVALEKSLRSNTGWQKLIKRGLHTLTMPHYQLCFVDPGIARGEELEQLKTLHSTPLKF